MRHGLPSPWVAGRTAYARWAAAGTPGAGKCRNRGNRSGGCGEGKACWIAGSARWPKGRLVGDSPMMESRGNKDPAKFPFHPPEYVSQLTIKWELIQ
ncbi:hypothetical protein DF044_36785 [Burkholderia contaminans]|nr:hypothetical protein DF044_36785 [Burkholderia contaminans]